VEQLWDAGRRHARPQLDDLAQRIDAGTSWSDLVLPEAQIRLLREIALHVRHRGTVYEQWGFALRGGRGLGLSALFTGSSGTGKTTAAEVLANELSAESLETGTLFPPLSQLRHVSRKIAEGVVRIAREEGIGDDIADTEIPDAVEREMWEPDYPEIVPE
jgi:DNA polymerase III delta prime subunit